VGLKPAQAGQDRQAAEDAKPWWSRGRLQGPDFCGSLFSWPRLERRDRNTALTGSRLRVARSAKGRQARCSANKHRGTLSGHRGDGALPIPRSPRPQGPAPCVAQVTSERYSRSGRGFPRPPPAPPPGRSEIGANSLPRHRWPGVSPQRRASPLIPCLEPITWHPTAPRPSSLPDRHERPQVRRP
jgi:hypothetical protein